MNLAEIRRKAAAEAQNGAAQERNPAAVAPAAVAPVGAPPVAVSPVPDPSEPVPEGAAPAPVVEEEAAPSAAASAIPFEMPATAAPHPAAAAAPEAEAPEVAAAPAVAPAPAAPEVPAAQPAPTAPQASPSQPATFALLEAAVRESAADPPAVSAPAWDEPLEAEPEDAYPPAREPFAAGGEESTGFDPAAVILRGRESAGDGGEEVHEAEQVEELQELLCFTVANEDYAISIMDIKEIIKPREVTEVPRVPDFVRGILSLRGIIIPVFDLRLRLGLPAGERSERERIVVVQRRSGFCGVLVDRVVQVVRIPQTGIEPPPVVLEGIDREFVQGIGRVAGKMLILLDIEKVLDVSLL